MRFGDEFLEHAHGLCAHAQRGQRQRRGLFVEDSHDHRFAERRGDDAHANIDLAALGFDLESAVLRQALFGDVQTGQNLDAADDRQLKTLYLRRHRRVVQHAVDAIADLELSFIGLDVDVRRPIADRFDENLVDQLDDRGLLGHFDHVAGLVDGIADDLDVFFGDHVLDGRSAHTVELFDQAIDLGLGRQRHLDPPMRQHAQLVKGIQIVRIGGGHRERAVLLRDGNEAVAVHQFRRHDLEQFGVDGQRTQIDHRQGELLAHDLEHRFFLDEAHAHQHFLQRLVAGPLRTAGGLQLIAGNLALRQ